MWKKVNIRGRGSRKGKGQGSGEDMDRRQGCGCGACTRHPPLLPTSETWEEKGDDRRRRPWNPRGTKWGEGVVVRPPCTRQGRRR